MANTNTNTGNQNLLSTDVYDVSAFIDQIRADNITNLDDTNSMVGIFGYMNEAFTQSLQNALIVAAETSNEAIPTRAKFTKNVINHAMNYSITNIYAKPAQMTMMIYLPTRFIERNFIEYNEVSGKGKFILDRRVAFNVGNFEFHLDYDIILTRIKNPQGNYVYTAMYDLFENGTTIVKQQNPISDITNPYITTVIQTTLDNVDYVAFSAKLHQITLDEVNKSILTNNSIENKAVTFEFGDQLAAFDVDVIENGTTTNLTPIYAGLLDNTIEDGRWCYYEFINEHTIRVLFNRDSYVPGLNAEIRVNIQLCQGSAGNFNYTESFRTPLKSDEYGDYNGMYAYVYPLADGDSYGGRDKKSVEDLRRIIPREVSSRGAIINTTDLQNFFNSIDDYECKLFFRKKRDNQFERMYYAHLLMKRNGYVIPSNTLDVLIDQDNFKGFAANNNLVISPGTVFYYYDHGTDVANNFATVIPPTYEENLDPDDYPHNMTINADGDLVRVFEYTTPFLITIDDDLITSYLMTIINENKTFQFVSINTDSDAQFIATNMNWRRKFEADDGSLYDYNYTMTMDFTQNSGIDYNLIQYHTDANGLTVYDDIRVRCILVLYSDSTGNTPYRYIEGYMSDYDSNAKIYSFTFNMGTDDLMDLNNRINVTGIYNAKPEALQPNSSIKTSHGYMNKNTYAKVFILADFGTKPGDRDNYGNTVTEETAEVVLYGSDGVGNRSELEGIIPTRSDVIDAFLNNDIYVEKNGTMYSVCSIIRANPDYIQRVKDYNGTDQETNVAIMRYLRNNKDSEFVQDVLLQDDNVIDVIESYSYLNLSRYSVCNTMAVDGGLDFYKDYSSIMRSTVNVMPIQATDENGNLVFNEIKKTDTLGKEYTVYQPVYITNDNNELVYRYSMSRMPLIQNRYLDSEALMQDYVSYLEERRKYIMQCLYVLEDTFDIDLKFFNTYGPSKRFYYNIPSSTEYKVTVAIKELKVLSSTVDEDDETALVGTIPYGTKLSVSKAKGLWGYITEPLGGWVKLADTTKVVNYIDNVALNFKFALEAESSADKYIADSIVQDIKGYIEDINEVNELHIPNIITLITNNYREQLVYFEFMDVNGYGSACQHLYHDDTLMPDITPEFLNVETVKSGSNIPNIEIVVY